MRDPRRRHHPLRHANPDGNDLLADWYMRKSNPLERSTGNIPKLYQKYIGHDNNRDFFMSTQAETENISRVLYHQWMPQVLYNHHQSGPAGTVFWSPPLRDPYNPNLDPIVILGYQALGAAMHSRLAPKGSPGRPCAAAGRTTAGGTAASATRLVSQRNRAPDRNDREPHAAEDPAGDEPQTTTADYAYPIAPQEWHSGRAWIIRSRSIARC
jgi:hypothetical protein